MNKIVYVVSDSTDTIIREIYAEALAELQEFRAALEAEPPQQRSSARPKIVALEEENAKLRYRIGHLLRHTS